MVQLMSLFSLLWWCCFLFVFIFKKELLELRLNQRMEWYNPSERRTLHLFVEVGPGTYARLTNKANHMSPFICMMNAKHTLRPLLSITTVRAPQLCSGGTVSKEKRPVQSPCMVSHISARSRKCLPSANQAKPMTCFMHKSQLDNDT